MHNISTSHGEPLAVHVLGASPADALGEVVNPEALSAQAQPPRAGGYAARLGVGKLVEQGIGPEERDKRDASH